MHCVRVSTCSIRHTPGSVQVPELEKLTSETLVSGRANEESQHSKQLLIPKSYQTIKNKTVLRRLY